MANHVVLSIGAGTVWKVAWQTAGGLGT